MRLLSRAQQFARQIETEIHVLALAYQDRRTPWYAKLLVACIVAYALSPIDLIPDPIPVLGFVDDLILLPAGLWLALRLIPPQVMWDARKSAAAQPIQTGLGGTIAAMVIIIIWLTSATLLVVVAKRFMTG